LVFGRQVWQERHERPAVKLSVPRNPNANHISGVGSRIRQVGVGSGSDAIVVVVQVANLGPFSNHAFLLGLDGS